MRTVCRRLDGVRAARRPSCRWRARRCGRCRGKSCDVECSSGFVLCGPDERGWLQLPGSGQSSAGREERAAAAGACERSRLSLPRERLLRRRAPGVSVEAVARRPSVSARRGSRSEPPVHRRVRAAGMSDRLGAVSWRGTGTRTSRVRSRRSRSAGRHSRRAGPRSRGGRRRRA